MSLFIDGRKLVDTSKFDMSVVMHSLTKDEILKADLAESNALRVIHERVNAGDTAWLKSNQRDSKIIIITEDSIPSDPPMLFIYAGTAGKTAGNTIVVDHIKVEKSSVATPWIPAIEDQDVVMKSDFDSLKSELDNLKSHMGG